MLESRVVKTTYSGNGIRTTYPIIFPFVLTTDIELWLTSPTGVMSQLTSNYSVDVGTLNVVYPTPQSYLPPLAADWKLTMLRKVPLTQVTSWAARGSFNANTLEAVLDRLTMMVQQIDETLLRCPKWRVDQVPAADTVDEFLSTMNTSKAAAAASASAAAASATNAAASATSAASFVDRTGTYEQLIALGVGVNKFFGWATDKDLLLYYTGDPSKGDRGFIIIGGAASLPIGDLG